ncbi:MAG: hypothetical protein JNL28_01080 [Planctomycetes bacterium]|nr:hypothetical protein [Planctomycetota bacterium]
MLGILVSVLVAVLAGAVWWLAARRVSKPTRRAVAAVIIVGVGVLTHASVAADLRENLGICLVCGEIARVHRPFGILIARPFEAPSAVELSEHGDALTLRVTSRRFRGEFGPELEGHEHRWNLDIVYQDDERMEHPSVGIVAELWFEHLVRLSDRERAQALVRKTRVSEDAVVVAAMRSFAGLRALDTDAKSGVWRVLWHQSHPDWP